MTEDTTNTTQEVTPIQAVEGDAGQIRHDGEVAVHHGLSHLEAEFVTYAKEVLGWAENEAKAALEWVAAKL